eukprot:TRINITY_DN7976_c0_g1_i8.p1 TRINITY_DN7976_c0_g1~~TRINITY_DN7976_c0_g1_i8.p1  ORF type:complete len:231 (+),score=79.19 TRINITY_DN7976_c0_g1_i8:153-845(+)
MNPLGPTAKSLLPSIATDLVCQQAMQDKQAQASTSHSQASTEQQKEAKAAYSKEDEDDLDMEDDPEYQKYKAKRMTELKAAHEEAATNKAKGHGEYNEIDESEFLSAVTKSKNVVCHFYHREFERCKIVDEHLKKICIEHIEAKFIKINAEKAPFFVGKLQIKVLPTIVCFIDGIAVDRVVGFEDLGGKDDFPTLVLVRRLVQAKVLKAKRKEEKPGFHMTKGKNEEDSD